MGLMRGEDPVQTNSLKKKVNSKALEFALYLHTHIYENIKFVETKNSFILGATGAFITLFLSFVLSVFEKNNPYWLSRDLFLVGGGGLCICWLITMWYSLLSLSPKLMPSESIFYFNSIAKMEKTKLVEQISTANDFQTIQEIMQHTQILANIAAYKYQKSALSLFFLKLSLFFLLPFVVSLFI